MGKIYRWLDNHSCLDFISLVLAIPSFICGLLGLLLKVQVLSIICIVLILVMVIRTSTGNEEQHSRQNRAVIKAVSSCLKGIKVFFNNLYSSYAEYLRHPIRCFKDRKTYKYLRCSQCHTILRLPVGKGQITIRCPHCGNIMKKRT